LGLVQAEGNCLVCAPQGHPKKQAGIQQQVDEKFF